MSSMDELVARYLHLQDIVKEATDEQNDIKKQLRDLGAGDHPDNSGHIVRVTPTRRFDPKLAAITLPAQLVDLISEKVITAAKAKATLPPATYEGLMSEVGQPRVTIVEEEK